MKAHTRSPVSNRISKHAAYSNSPRTDNGDGVGANTSSLTVVAKSFSTHLDLTSLTFNCRAQPVSRTDLLGGMSVSLTQEYSCRSFICWISRSSPALTLSASSPSIKAPSLVARIARCAFGQASSLTSKFHTVLPTKCEKSFLLLVPSSTRFHRRLVPVDEMSLVLFGSYPHPFGSPSSRCLSHRLFLISSGWDLLNSNSGPAVVCPDLQQFRVSPPPLMLFGGYLPRHLDTSCMYECVTSLDQESRMPGTREFCRFLTRKL